MADNDDSVSNFETVLQRCITDYTFANSLLENPKAALESLGIQVTPEKLDALYECIHPLRRAHREFGGLIDEASIG